ncbi:MAG: EscU/YscU/HrcU family type III secretion system export apparatus switch protein, partial [Firmicutes bacterium]|nr:EscU/YscU/HrcU family type III secretion system export apparatus switch protein [Bacillota bacterium]
MDNLNRLHLNLQFFAGEKTEKATPKKRQDQRKKGQVLKSQDVTSAIVLLS